MELSKKLKICYEFLIAFVELKSNFSYAEKMDELQSSSTSENIDPEKRDYLNVWKGEFKDTLELLRNFARFFHFCWSNFDIKHPSWEHLKSQDC